MRVLITGASGLIGRAVAERLRSSHEVVVLCRASGRSAAAGLQVHVGDLLDPASLRAAMLGVAAVIHCAGATEATVGLERMVETNHAGTRNVVRAALAAGVRRFVHASSSVTVGGPGDGEIYDEDDVFAWGYLENAYHDSKRAAEDEVLAAVRDGLDAVILNPVQVCAAGDSERKNLRLVRKVSERGGWLYPVGGISVTCLDPVAEAFVAALERGERGTRYLLAGPNLTYGELLGAVARRAGTRPPRLPVGRRSALGIELASRLLSTLLGRPLGLPRGAARGFEHYAYYRSDRAARALGYRPPSLDEAISQLIG